MSHQSLRTHRITGLVEQNFNNRSNSALDGIIVGLLLVLGVRPWPGLDVTKMQLRGPILHWMNIAN